jgi:hypothetical protein
LVCNRSADDEDNIDKSRTVLSMMWMVMMQMTEIVTLMMVVM